MEKIATIQIRDEGTKLTQEQLDLFNRTYPKLNPIKFKDIGDFSIPSGTYNHSDYKEGDIDHNTRLRDNAFRLYEKSICKSIKGDYHTREITVSITRFMHQFPTVRFQLVEVIDIPDISMSQVDLAHQIAQIHSATKSLEEAGSLLKTFNDKVEVHIGGSLLMTVNRVKVERDMCTEVLQQELDAGWRILSVCVQSDQRRPDYVLGKYEPK